MPERPPLRFCVFASPKSGTTWVRRMLAAHPDLHCAETHLFGPHFSARGDDRPQLTIERFTFWTAQTATDAAGDTVDPEARRELGDRMLRGYIDATARALLETTGKTWYGEKITPYLGTAAAVVDRVAWYDPSTVVLHLVRDPRDVAVSGLCHAAWSRTDDTEDARSNRHAVERGQMLDQNLGWALERWLDAARAGLDAEARLPAVRARYEDLLVDPRPMLRDLLTRVGVDASEGVVAACVDAGRFDALAGGRARGSEDRGSFFRSGTAGDWTRWLSPEQNARVVAQAGSLLDAFGYERDADGGVPSETEGSCLGSRREAV
jgi:hypothetical protein